MKMYIVYSLQKKGDDEFELLRTLNKQEAINFAQEAERKECDKKYFIELREYDISENVNYKTFDDYEDDNYNDDIMQEIYSKCNIIYFNFQKKLKKYKEEKNISIPKMAKILKIPQRTLENWIFEKSLPNDFTKNAVIRALNEYKGN